MCKLGAPRCVSQSGGRQESQGSSVFNSLPPPSSPPGELALLGRSVGFLGLAAGWDLESSFASDYWESSPACKPCLGGLGQDMQSLVRDSRSDNPGPNTGSIERHVNGDSR